MYFREAFVEHRKWLSETEYLNIVTLCQTLPGPASSQVGFSIGLMRAGLLGALLAFIAFTLPSILVLITFANYLYLFDSDLGQAALQGLAILALAVVLHGVIGMGKQLCKQTRHFTIAVLTFVALLLAPSPAMQVVVIVLGAAAAYFFRGNSRHQNIDAKTSDFTLKLKTSAKWSVGLAPFFALSFIVLLFSLAYIWPLADDFYRSGALVFGGGHVVMPLLESALVSVDKLSETEFLAGYGATQAVPGPMFSFAAYLGYLMPGNDGGIIGALTASIFIFLPGFLLVLAVLPYWQRISQHTQAQDAIAGASAAVVGLLAAALYDSIFTHAILHAHDLAVAAIAYAALARWKIPVLFVVVFCVLAKVLLAFFY
jgi:chromate transporter